MVAKRSRAAQKKGKRRQQQRNRIIALVAVLFLAIGGFFLIKNTILNNSSSTASQPTKVSSTSSAGASANSSTTASSDVSTSNSDSSIVWEKQEKPVQLPILMYHAIHDMAPEEEANANLIVSPATFESHLKAMQEANYYAVTPEEAYKILTENVLPKGKKPVWLTFDDSLWDFYDVAYPILKKYNMHATNNVITGTVGNSGNLTLDQMKEMKQNGISLESHTVNHPDLEYSTIEAQTSELNDSKAYLDSNLNQDTIAVAYPAGRYSSDTLSIAEQAKYKLGVTTNEGLATASNGLLSLNRTRMLPNMTADILLQTIATE